MNLLKKNKIDLLDIYLFLFIFLSINREFTPLGFEIRFILPFIALILFITQIKKNGIKKIIQKIEYFDIFIFVFYLIVFLCNISWITNDYKINLIDFINLIILHLNNFLIIIICFLNKNKIIFEKITKYFLISLIVLIISAFFCVFDIPLSGLISSDYSGIFIGGENINGFGLPFRIAGFAQDPNYASCFYAIGLILLWFNNKINIYKRLVFATAIIFCFYLSWSKTIIIALFFGIFIMLILQKAHTKEINVLSNKINLDYLLFIMAIFFVFIFLAFIPFENIKTNSISLSSRFFMWNNAQDLFFINPVIGNGIASFRNYFYDTSQWYVHCHSTFLQILAEMGILGATSFGILIFNSYKKGSFITQLILIIFLIWSLTYETIYLQIFVIVIYIIVIASKNNKKTGKNVLFFVNSFGQGGAERVCINLAEGYINNGYNVDFITLYDENKFEINPLFNVFSFKMKRKSSKFRRIIGLLLGLYKMDKFIKNQNDNFGYILISSHLPMSNIIARLSIVSKECLYVMHTPCSTFAIINDKIYQYLLKVTFWGRKIVAVSNGVKKEMIKRYCFSEKQIKTIYNPLLLDDIKIKMNDSLNYNRAYFLFVGRLIRSKRVDRLLKIFVEGKFYLNYDLVLVGNGDEETEIKHLIEENELSKYVKFIGWQDNVYKWMKNSKLLIFTSDYEAFGMVLLEALATGCKVVSANCDYGPSEILVDEYKNYLVNDIDDIDEYIDKINNALLAYPDPAKNRMIKICDINNVIEEYIEFYKS